MKRTRPRARAELSRERILSTALELIGQKGLAALNMRSLGAQLGASTMSVYRHFKDKEDLLNAVVDHVVAGFAPSGSQGTWRQHAKSMSLTVRAAMLAHPDLADLIGREFRRSATSLRVNTEIIKSLASSGVPRRMLAQTYWAVSCYTTGHALLEAQALKRRAGRPKQNLSTEERAKKLAVLLRDVEDIDRDAVTDGAKVLSRPLDDRQFLFGLESLLDGIEARLGA